MYEPSTNFYNNVVKQQVRHITWSGKITTEDNDEYPFTAEHIVKDSGTITNEIASDEMEIGTVYSSELTIGLYVDEIEIPRSKIYGAVIEIYCTISHGETSGVIPMGKFDVVEATQKGNVCTVTAYDFMSRFDKEYPATSGSNTAYGWASIFASNCNVSLAQSDFDDFANADIYLQMIWTDKVDTYRDALGQLAAAMGCSAHMNRFGQLEFLPLTEKTPVTTMTANDRFGSDIAHTTWEIHTVYVTNTETGLASQEGYGQMILDLGENSFLQSDGEIRDLTWEVIDTRSVHQMLFEILRQIWTSEEQTVSAVPIEAEIPLDPCLDLFDFVTLTGGQANNTRTLITSLIHKIGGSTKIACAGANSTDYPQSSSRGTTGSDEKQMWITSSQNNSAITVTAVSMNWGNATEYTWEFLNQYTWGDLLSGVLPAVIAEAYFTPPKEMNRGVVSFTVNYTLDADATVLYGIKVDGETVWELQETQTAGDIVKTITTPVMMWDREEASHKIQAVMLEVSDDDSN